MEYEVVDDTLNKEVLNEPEVSIPPEDEVEDVDDEGEGEGEETEEEKKAASLLVHELRECLPANRFLK